MACNPQELMAEAACFACIQPNQRALAIVALLCQISNNAGGAEGGGGNSILSGPGSPDGSVSATGPAVYIQDDGTVWVLPSGGGINDWVQASAGIQIPVMAPPPEPDHETINRLASVEQSINRLEGRPLVAPESIDQLQVQFLGLQEAVEGKADKVALDAAEEAAVQLLTKEMSRSAELERKLEAVTRELNESVKLHVFEAFKAEQKTKLEAPVVMPTKKSPWWKRAWNSMNIFA